MLRRMQAANSKLWAWRSMGEWTRPFARDLNMSEIELAAVIEGTPPRLLHIAGPN